MTVKELQEELSKYPPDMKVISADEGIFSEAKQENVLVRHMVKQNTGYEFCKKEVGEDVLIIF